MMDLNVYLLLSIWNAAIVSMTLLITVSYNSSTLTPPMVISTLEWKSACSTMVPDSLTMFTLSMLHMLHLRTNLARVPRLCLRKLATTCRATLRNAMGSYPSLHNVLSCNFPQSGFGLSDIKILTGCVVLLHMLFHLIQHLIDLCWLYILG